jgi:hypothetical protein
VEFAAAQLSPGREIAGPVPSTTQHGGSTVVSMGNP